MYADIHNPKREACNVLTNENGSFATVRFIGDVGGTMTMFFSSPDDLRNHATALKLLAEALEEKQA